MTTRWTKKKMAGWRRVVLELSPKELALLESEYLAHWPKTDTTSSFFLQDAAVFASAVLLVALRARREDRCRWFRSYAYKWFHRAAAAASVLVALAIAGCSSAGALPLVGREDLCIEVTKHWEDRVHACGHTDWKGNYAKCDAEVELFVSSEARDTCLAELDALDCDKFTVLPASCSRLFQGGL